MNLLGVSVRSGTSVLIVAHETEKNRRRPKIIRLVTALLVTNSNTLGWMNENNVFARDSGRSILAPRIFLVFEVTDMRSRFLGRD